MYIVHYGVERTYHVICTSELIEVWSCLVFHVDYQWVSSRVLGLGVWDVVERDSVWWVGEVTHCTWSFHYGGCNDAAFWSPHHCPLLIGNSAHACSHYRALLTGEGLPRNLRDGEFSERVANHPHPYPTAPTGLGWESWTWLDKESSNWLSDTVWEIET